MITKYEHAPKGRVVRVSFADGSAADVKQVWPDFAGEEEVEKEARMVALQVRAANCPVVKAVFAMEEKLVQLGRAARKLCDKFRGGNTAANDYWRALAVEPSPRFVGEAKKFHHGTVEEQYLAYVRDLKRLSYRLAGDECDRLHSHLMANLRPSGHAEYHCRTRQWCEPLKQLKNVATFYPPGTKRPPLDPPAEESTTPTKPIPSPVVGWKKTKAKGAAKPAKKRNAAKPRLRIAIEPKPAAHDKKR